MEGGEGGGVGGGGEEVGLVADDKLGRSEVREGEVVGDVVWERRQGCGSWEREVEGCFEGGDGTEDNIDDGVHRAKKCIVDVEISACKPGGVVTT